jgi:hypothetical protein
MRLATMSLVVIGPILAWPLVGSDVAQAADRWNHETAYGLSVYLGVLPAAMVARAHPADHPEIEMHDGPPPGRHDQHVSVAIFNVATGERVEDATVEARVAPLGLAAVARPLEPMAIADTITYGNYFAMREDGRYWIRILVTPAGAARTVPLEFSYDHRTR